MQEKGRQCLSKYGQATRLAECVANRGCDTSDNKEEEREGRQGAKREKRVEERGMMRTVWTDRQETRNKRPREGKEREGRY